MLTVTHVISVVLILTGVFTWFRISRRNIPPATPYPVGSEILLGKELVTIVGHRHSTRNGDFLYDVEGETGDQAVARHSEMSSMKKVRLSGQEKQWLH